MRKARIKLEDVARHAGVGVGTVSRVLNNAKNVSAPTRERVLKTIATLGYVPNLVARGLAANRTGIVAAIVPSLGYSQHSEVAQSLAEYLMDHGISVMVGSSGYDPEIEAKLVTDFLARRPDAFYLTGVTHSAATRRVLKQSGVPVIEGSNLTDQPIDCIVGYSNFEAMRQMAHRLHARGYRHIVHANFGAGINDRNRDRQSGYDVARNELGISQSLPILTVPNSLEGGAQAVKQIRELRCPVDALQFGNDILAVGALLECQRRGIKVPGDIAISGFDDLAIAAFAVPPLTTVRIDRGEIGRRAGKMLLQRLSGSKVTAKIVDIGFEIIERQSA